ncbi:hypothetical protein HDK77DRAFT_274380 [Phyllosticta capitalensis]
MSFQYSSLLPDQSTTPGNAETSSRTEESNSTRVNESNSLWDYEPRESNESDRTRPKNVEPLTLAPTASNSSKPHAGDQEKEQRRPPFLHRLKGWWLWEIAGICFSISCTISIVVIICYVSANKTLHQWNFRLGPNTLISIFVTLAKTSMLLAVAQGLGQLKWVHYRENSRPLSELNHFDEASRGPFGALKFLCSAKTSALTAALGALIVVVSLAMDPFAQQIISFDTRYVPNLGEVAAIPVSTAYDTAEAMWLSGSEYADLIDMEIQQYYFMGVFGIRRQFAFPYTCATGNCTWPDFTTLGMCTKCQNITSTVTYSQSSDIRTYHTPGNVTLVTELPSARNNIQDGNWIVGNGRVNFPNGEESQEYEEGGVFATVAFAQTLVEKPSQSMRLEPEVTECEFSWCGKVFSNVSVTNTTLSEYLVNEVPLRSTEETRNICDNINYNMSSYEIPITTFAPATTSDETKLAADQTFKVNCLDSRRLAEFVVARNTFNVSLVHLSGFSLSGMAVVLGTGVDDTMSRIADIWTLAFLKGGRNSTTLIGEALSPEVFVVVRWAWFVLPAALVLLSAIFLALSVTINSATAGKTPTPLWKTSLVPLLFHGLEGWSRDELRIESEADMSVAAHSMKARLQKNEDGDAKFLRA